MERSTKKILFPLLILGMAALVALVLLKTKPQAEPVVIQEKAWPVATVAVQREPLSPQLTLYGRIEAQWDSRLTAALAADVATVPAREGMSVEADAVLVQLDDADARLRLAQAEADLVQATARIESEQARNQANVDALPRERNLLALARKELSRTRDLLKKKLASQSTLDSARQAVDRQAIALSKREQSIREHESRMAELTAARQRAEASRDQQALDLERATIRAPFAGRVSARPVSPGQRVRVGDLLVSLYDTGNLLVRAQIPDSQLALVRAAMGTGQSLQASGGLDGRPLAAELDRLAGKVGQGGGVAGLFRLQGDTAELRPGRFVKLTLRLPARHGLVAVPGLALYGPDRVYRVDGDERLRPLQVQRAGESRDADGNSLVLLRGDGLKPGDRILATQLPNAVDGLKVQVVGADG